MYNEELKTRYIKEREQEVIMPFNYLYCQFNKTAFQEKELGKDLSNFTAYEIMDFYKMLNTSSLDFLAVLNSHFANYTQWCLQQNLVNDNQNHFIEINRNTLKKCVNSAALNMKIVSQETLYKWVDELFNARDKFIFLALFEGIKGQANCCELVNLRHEDINDNIASLCTNRTIKISDKLVEIAKQCKKEEVYYNPPGCRIPYKNLVDEGYVVKDFSNTSIKTDYRKGRNIFNSILRALNSLGAPNCIYANDIYDSGRIHFIKTRSAELGISPKEYIYSNYAKEVEDQYGFKMIQSSFFTKYEQFLV